MKTLRVLWNNLGTSLSRFHVPGFLKSSWPASSSQFQNTSFKHVLSIGMVISLLAIILVMAISFEQTPSAKDYFYQYGTQETGAINLVTSIYLGYRAFDTLGETIVLMLAVAGVILMIGQKS